MVSGNILLAGLEAADRALLLRQADEIATPGGTLLLRANAPLDAVYFPQAATVSLQETFAGDQAVEVAVIGREGMLGWPALLGSRSSPHSAIVRARSGTVLRLGAEPLRMACRHSPALLTALLRFVHVVMVQMARAIASHLQQPLGPRVARWLLMRHDRLGGDILFCHHDEIARCLGVRRASITDQLHLIEGELLIRCYRGRVVVRDRVGLERLAGETYGHAEGHYRELIAPFGKSAPAGLLH